MKKAIIAIFFFITLLSFNVNAQKDKYTEKFGNTLNLGLGIGGYSGYYGYVGRTLPVFHINYELNVAKNFTLAPFISFFTYKNDYYWSNHQYYYYRETVIPIGVKGTYYFDQLLRASSNWDFYAAGSLGFSIVKSSWENGYPGDRNYYRNASPLFLDLHAGAEYHINNKIGLFLDLSTGVSTVGIAIH